MKNSSFTGRDWNDDEEDLVCELENVLKSLKEQESPNALQDEDRKEEKVDVYRIINRINELDRDSEEDHS